jgi:hypothetical protein
LGPEHQEEKQETEGIVGPAAQVHDGGSFDPGLSYPSMNDKCFKQILVELPRCTIVVHIESTLERVLNMAAAHYAGIVGNELAIFDAGKQLTAEVGQWHIGCPCGTGRKGQPLQVPLR